MYSIDYFKTHHTQMEIGQVICIHGQYPCSLWYVKNINTEYNSCDGYESMDEDVEYTLATLYEVEYNGTDYYPKLNPPKILQVYISNIQYNIISSTSIMCKFPSNYIQLYHLQRVAQRKSQFGDMIQLKYYDAFMPFMIINYEPVDKAHFVMSLHTSRIFKTYHLILELSEFSTISTKELRYSIITSKVNKGYSLELQKIDSAIDYKTRANYLFIMDKDVYDLEDFITKSNVLYESSILDESSNIPTKSMEWYCHSSDDNNDDSSTSNDDYTDASVSPRLPIYIPMKVTKTPEISLHSQESYTHTYTEDDIDYYYNQYLQEEEDKYYKQKQQYQEEQYQEEQYQKEQDHEQQYQQDQYQEEQYQEEQYQEEQDQEQQQYQEEQYQEEQYQEQDETENYNQSIEAEEEKEEKYDNYDQEQEERYADNQYKHEEYVDNTTEYSDKDYESQYNNDNIDNDNVSNTTKESKPLENTDETYSFFTDDIINELKSFFNEDAKKEIDELLNDSDVIEVGHAIKNAFTEVISYLHTSYDTTEEVSTPIIQEEVSTPIIQEEAKQPLPIEDELYNDVIIINNNDIIHDDVSINEAPTPCSIM